jgi:hypothetical protein
MHMLAISGGVTASSRGPEKFPQSLCFTLIPVGVRPPALVSA